MSESQENIETKPKHAGGRPRKYKTVEDLQAAIDRYFTEEDKTTVCGLALYLGFNSRQSFADYCEYGDEFSDTIKKAKFRIECNYEKYLFGDDKKPTGAIFALKNMGWSDKQELDVKGNLSITLTNYGSS